MSYIPDPELPGPVTAALGSAVGAVERYGWFVLIGALVLWYAHARWQEYARRRAVYNTERVSRLTADMRERRAAQQAAWDREAHGFHAGGAAVAGTTAAEHKADRIRAKLYGLPGKAQLNDGSAGSVAAAADALELPVPLPKADKKKSSAAAAGASAADTKEQRANRPQPPSDGAQPKPKPKPKFGDKPSGGFRPFFGSNSNSSAGAGGSSARWGRIKPAACGPSGG